MSLKKKLEQSMFKYVDFVILPACYDVMAKLVEDQFIPDREQFNKMVLEEMKGK